MEEAEEENRNEAERVAVARRHRSRSRLQSRLQQRDWALEQAACLRPAFCRTHLPQSCSASSPSTMPAMLLPSWSSFSSSRCHANSENVLLHFFLLTSLTAPLTANCATSASRLPLAHRRLHTDTFRWYTCRC